MTRGEMGLVCGWCVLAGVGGVGGWVRDSFSQNFTLLEHYTTCVTAEKQMQVPILIAAKNTLRLPEVQWKEVSPMASQILDSQIHTKSKGSNRGRIDVFSTGF